MEYQCQRQSRLIEHFWKLRRSEYLTPLRQFHRTAGHNEQCISVGDFVQIHNESRQTNWKIWIITEFVRGNDEYVRSARIRTSTGETSRPIAKLYPLEVTHIL